MATDDYPGETPLGSSKGDGIRRPTNYSRSANKHNPHPILGETAGANTLVLCRSMPWKLCEHPCCLSVAESRSGRIEEADNLCLI